MIKGLGKSRVATVLLDIDYGALKQPLNQFNGLRPTREGAYHLVKSFNKVSDRPIKGHVLERTFEKFWNELESAFKKIFPDSHRHLNGVTSPVHVIAAETPEKPAGYYNDGAAGSDASCKKPEGKKAHGKKPEKNNPVTSAKDDQHAQQALLFE